MQALVVVTAGVAYGLLVSPAHAYRPFDGTDADVAPTGEVELEVGPVQYYRQGHENFLTAPAFVFNQGLFADTELVVNAQQQLEFTAPRGNAPRPNLRGDDLLLKHVFRNGVLQGKSGLSVAAEGGALLPELAGAHEFGASFNLITSCAWSSVALHWNEWFLLDREGQASIFTGLIVEGPQAWPVRPVAELFYARTFSGEQTSSLLLGAIWRARESLALDLGARGAKVGHAYAGEARLGFTWSFAGG